MHTPCSSPGDGQTSCKVWLTSIERRRCSNEAKTRRPLKFAGVPQTHPPISAVSVPMFTMLWAHVEEILMFNNFFPIVDTCFSCEDITPQSCAMARRWRFLRNYFASCMSQRAACSTFQTCILNSQLTSHHRPLRIGEEKRKKKKPQLHNI